MATSIQKDLLIEKIAELNYPDSGCVGEAMRGFMQGGDELFVGSAVAKILPPVRYKHEERGNGHLAADFLERVLGRADIGEQAAGMAEQAGLPN